MTTMSAAHESSPSTASTCDVVADLHVGALPHHVLVHILSFLELHDLLRAAEASKTWLQASKEHSLWQSLATQLKLSSGLLLEPLRAVRHHHTATLWTSGTSALFNCGAGAAQRSTAPVCCWSRSADRRRSAPPAAAAADGGSAVFVACASGEHYTVLLTAAGEVFDSRHLDTNEGSNNSSTAAAAAATAGQLVMPTLWRPPCLSDSVVAVAAGAGHTLAVTAAGDVWGWGANQHGQLGLGITSDWVGSPTCITEVLSGDWRVPEDVITQVAAGGAHSVLCSSSGRLYLAGDNSSGQCAAPLDTEEVLVFTAMEGPPVPVVHLAAGHANTAAVAADGSVWVVGDNSCSQCGLNCQLPASHTFTQVGPSASWHGMPRVGQITGGGGGNAAAEICQVACGRASIYALTIAGDLFSWGQGSQGELGTGGATRCCSTPARLTWSKNIVLVNSSCCSRSAAAVDSAGRLYTWGAGKHGQLGHGDTHKRTVGRQVKAVAADEVLTAALGNEQLLVLTTWRPQRSSAANSSSSSSKAGRSCDKGAAQHGGSVLSRDVDGSTTVLGTSAGTTAASSSSRVAVPSSSSHGAVPSTSSRVSSSCTRNRDAAAPSGCSQQGVLQEGQQQVYSSSCDSTTTAEDWGDWTSVRPSRKALSRAAAVAAAGRISGNAAAVAAASEVDTSTAAETSPCSPSGHCQPSRQAVAVASGDDQLEQQLPATTRDAAAGGSQRRDQQRGQGRGPSRGGRGGMEQVAAEDPAGSPAPWASRRSRRHLAEEMAAAAAAGGASSWREFSRPMDLGFKGTLKRLLKAFVNDPSQRELELPTSLSASDRYKVHVVADAWGLAHQSYGAEPERFIKVWKASRRRPASKEPAEEGPAAATLTGSSSSSTWNGTAGGAQT